MLPNTKIGFLIFALIYFSIIIAEAWYSKKKNLNLYNYKDSALNLFLGLLVVVTRIFFDVILFSIWATFFHFSFFKIDNSLINWMILFICNEFIYYWYHRFSHHNRLLWAIHVNHHSSTKLNLLTAARVPVFSIIIQGLFWSPLLLIGFQPYMVFIILQIGFGLTAFQHIRIMGNLPLFEYVFNSPALHEVHHANNPEYINHNFGLVLSIFDRMFGTLKSKNENIPITYGITNNINTHNPVLVIFHEWIAIVKDLKKKYLRNN